MHMQDIVFLGNPIFDFLLLYICSAPSWIEGWNIIRSITTATYSPVQAPILRNNFPHPGHAVHELT